MTAEDVGPLVDQLRKLADREAYSEEVRAYRSAVAGRARFPPNRCAA